MSFSRSQTLILKMDIKFSILQERFFNDIAVKQGFQHYSLNILGGTSKGDGYMGTITFVEMKEKSSGKSLRLVLKSANTENTFKEKELHQYIYQREFFIYGVMFKEFSNLQKEFNVKDEFSGTPKYYGGLIEPNEKFIVLEDLRGNGFRLWDRKKPMDGNHVTTVIQQYGRFHALSYAMKKFKPKIFIDKTKNLFEVFEQIMKEEDMIKSFKFFIGKAFKAVDKNVKAIDGLKRYESTAMEFLSEINKVRDKFSVLMHGDCWCNNLMFKYQDDQPTNPTTVCILDWQVSTIGSPFMDLSYFFYACSSEDCINNHETFLKIYHESLSNMLEQFGIKAEQIITWEEVLSQWKIYAKYGLYISLLLIKVMLTDKEEVREVKDLEEDKHILTLFENDITNEKEYLRRIRIVINHMVEYNFI